MVRVLVITCVMALGSGVAAQPQPPPPPQQWQQPPPPGYGYPPPVALTPEEQTLLAEGEMTVVEHVGGGALAFVIGFGSGQLMQGRWSDTGYIFTFGEIASIGAIIIGVRDFADCLECDNTRAGLLIGGGIIAFTGLHIWEVLDAFIVPANRNKRVRALRARLGYPPTPQPFSMFVVPPRDGSGAIGGLTLRF